MMFLSLLFLLIFPLSCCYCYCVRSNSTTTTTLHDDIPVRGVSDADDLPPPIPTLNQRDVDMLPINPPMNRGDLDMVPHIPPLNRWDNSTSAQTNYANDVPSNRPSNQTHVFNEDVANMTSAQTRTTFEGTHAVEEHPSYMYISFDGTHAFEEHSSQTYTNFEGTHAVERYSLELAVAEILPLERGMITDHHFIVTSLEQNCQRARYPTDEELGSSSPAPDLHARIVYR